MAEAADLELQELMIAARAGEVGHARLLRALLAHPLWLAPLANDEPSSLRPHCLTDASGRKALPLYSSIPTLLEAGWGERPYCELSAAKAFGAYAPDIEAIVVDSCRDAGRTSTRRSSLAGRERARHSGSARPARALCCLSDFAAGRPSAAGARRSAAPSAGGFGGRGCV